ncbi:LysR substrate-binding domain-containing protein [Streptomyces sp. NPDC004532]
MVPPALARLRATHPAVHITLRELEQRQTHALLFRGEIDLAITFDYEHAPGPVPTGLTQEHLMDDPIMVVLPVGHPLAGTDGVTPADLPSDAWINTAVDARDLAASPLEGDRGSGHRLDFDGMDFRTALNLVAAGLGVALLPRLYRSSKSKTRPRRASIRARSSVILGVVLRWIASTAQRTSLLPCLVTCPRRTVVSDS